MYDFVISKEQARQFAYACYDAIVRDIKAGSKTTDKNVAEKFHEERKEKKL